MAFSFKSALSFILNSLPAFIVLGLLGVVGYFGHKYDWKWLASNDSQEEKKDENKPIPDRPETKALGRSPSDPTLTVTHDPAICPSAGKEIPFKGLDDVRRSGISLGKVERRTMETTLTVPAITDFEPTRVARIAPRVGGVLRRIEKQVGDPVAPGELLAIVDSLEVGKAKAAFLLAKVQLEVKKQTRHAMVTGAVPQINAVQADAAIREAEVSLYAAEQGLINLGLPVPEKLETDTDKDFAKKLQFLGLPPKVVDSLQNETTGNLLPLFSPLKEAGTVLQREGSLREPVAALQTVFIIGETSELLVYLDVRQENARRIRPGMPIRFRPDGDLTLEANGKIDGISSEVDSKTRTVRMRARIENPDGKLKAKTFGSAVITLDRAEQALTVNDAAVQWEGCSHIVFVLQKATDGEAADFKVCPVTLGIREGGYVVVQPMLAADKFETGDEVAEMGSHVLKSYLFRDRIGDD